MKAKKITVILLAVAIVAVVIFSCLFIFSAREVEVKFNVSDNVDAVAVQKKLDKFKGRNLLFFNTNEIYGEFSDDPYMEISSVKKDYPNKILVSVKERVEAFSVVKGDKVLILSTDGVVLKEIPQTEYVAPRNLINIDLGADVKIVSSKIGRKIITDKDSAFYTAINMANAVSLSDCVRSITLLEQFKNFNATFDLYSGVQIIVTKIEDLGVDKIVVGFKAYNGEIADSNGNYITDYEKFTSSIYVVKLDDGTICPTWLGGN